MDVNKIIFGCLVAGLLASPSVSAQTTGRTVRKHRVPVEDSGISPLLAEAESAIDKQDYSAAEAKLKLALGKDPKDYRAWFDLGFVLSATGRPAEAIEAYRTSVAAKPGVFESNLNLGTLLAHEQHPDAEKYLRAATQLKPTAKPDEGRARAWLSLGRVVEKSRPVEALAAYAEAARLQPSNADPHLASAIILEKEGKLTEAEAEFRRALQLDPKSGDARAGLVNVYSRQKRFPEAEALLREYLQSNPASAAAHLQMGRLLLAQDRKPEALAEFSAGLKASGGSDADAKRELAALYAAGQDYEPAAALYRELLAQDPRNAGLHHAFGNLLMHQRRFPESQAELLTALKLDPKLADAYGDLAVVAAQNKDYQLAIQVLDARARYLPEAPATFFLRATSYDHLRLFTQASEYYKKFLQAAAGQFPDQEWQARHRLKAIAPKSK